MSKKLFLLLMLGMTTAQAQTIYPSGVTNCIARWDFATPETGYPYLPDVSNNQHQGTMYNLTSVSGFKSRPNQAMHFDGSSSYVQVTHDNALGPQQLTIVSLIRPTNFYSGDCQGNNIIYKGSSYHVNGCWGMFIWDHHHDNSCTVFSPNYEQMDYPLPSAPNHFIPAGNYITPGNWYFMAVSFDGNVLKRYQVLMDSATRAAQITPISVNTTNEPIGTNQYDVYIGKTQHPVFPYYFNGDMDEIAVFNKVLTDAEIKSVYDYLWGNNVGISSAPSSSAVDITCTGQQVRIQVPGGSTRPCHVDIYQLNGQKIHAHNYTAQSISVDVKEYAQQMLLIKVQTGQDQVIRKIAVF